MRPFFFLIILIANYSCDTGNLKTIIDLPIELTEVSGIAINEADGIFWMVNDSGNEPILYGINRNGAIVKSIIINAKNRDWEDLTTDPSGNIYIGDFGNNENNSKNLSILKINKDSIKANQKSITPERISFSYPEQKKYPPKKTKRHFDCEAFFFYKDSLYLFTKSRSVKEKGKTNLYQLPVKPGKYKAKYVNSFNTCDDDECWTTSADINKKGDMLALLTENSVFVFSELNQNNFFSSKVKRYTFKYSSQKESVAFKNDSTLYIADEYLGITGGKLYEFKID